MLRTLIFILCIVATPVFAVLPDEVLDDPILETRARALSKELRCLVCRNENIDSSNAGIARDLRLLVRERLVAGDSDTETLDFIVDRYGEYVLLKPRFTARNAILYLAGPMTLLIGVGLCVFYIRRRTPAVKNSDRLTHAEVKRLSELLDD
ncbi:MAG: cytochrome c-type biogenesis protein CcmH [Amylibacter sp.]|nr:cytochrome c-type biogenesis protein CcmH [Amylibacter sp.]